ncbi:MAG: Crp/Fnr family transcriptional regulator [Candidatus Delongbacteria bacterium]|nr:Crp/Fnr family transcriptional regulator [Candidatus Delongbacteria bacterium]MBN2834594.1 Crp/Fnr family transcriptional regulator [Candidatus Delongbacteria bacterium]
MTENRNKYIISKLKKFQIFENFQDFEIMKIIENSRFIKYDPNVIIFNEGDSVPTNNSFFVILKGDIQVYKSVYVENSFRSVLLNLLKDGDCFGEIAILNSVKKRTATLESLTECELIAINKEKFYELYNNHIFLKNLVTISHTNLCIANKVVVYAITSSKKHVYRLVYMLDFLISKYGVKRDNDIYEIILPFNSSLIADFLGSARQQYSKSKKILTEKNLIKGYGRKIIIPSYSKLLQYVSEGSEE